MTVPEFGASFLTGKRELAGRWSNILRPDLSIRITLACKTNQSTTQTWPDLAIGL